MASELESNIVSLSINTCSDKEEFGRSDGGMNGSRHDDDGPLAVEATQGPPPVSQAATARPAEGDTISFPITPTNAPSSTYAKDDDHHLDDFDQDHDDSDQDHDDNDDEPDQEDGPSTPPASRRSLLPPIAPQLDSLQLPSPIFGRSFVDLLATTGGSPSSPPPPPMPSIPTQYLDRGASPTPSAGSGGRPRRSSTLGSRSSRGNLRSPTFKGPMTPTPNRPELASVFTRPRPLKDERMRANGSAAAAAAAQDDYIFTAVYPDEGLDLDGEVEKWDEDTWNRIGVFLAERGYTVSDDDRTQATRTSDSLDLTLMIIPTDSDELDIVETLSTPGARSNATAQKVTPLVPVIGIVPLNDEWTAILSERWSPLPTTIDKDVTKEFLNAVVGALAFLHSSHYIAHLSLSQPGSILVHPTESTRYTLSRFSYAFQADPLMAAKKRAILIPSEDLPVSGEAVPEKGKIDPFKVDAWDLGKVVERILVEKDKVKELIEGLTRREPKDRMGVKEAREWVGKMGA